MSQTVYPGSVTSGTIQYNQAADSYFSSAVTWTHPGATYTVQQLAVQFVSTNSAYKVAIYENGSWKRTVNGTVASGSTVTIPLDSSYWEGKSGGSLTLRFYRPSYQWAGYTTIQLVMTYEANAQESTAVVPEVEAGQPQTVAITNSSDTVQHRVTWSYEGEVTHGPVLFGAATRYPAWAVPEEDLPTLYEAVTDRAYLAGTVTVETLTADGASLGSTNYTARLRIPDSVGPTLTVSTQAVHDAVADAAILAEGDQDLLVQNHTEIQVTPTAAGQYGASVALMTYTTPAGGASYSNQNAVTVTLTTAGSWALQVTAKDSRGLTRTVEVPVEVTACEAPRITAIDAQRWSSGDAGGHQDDEGGYAQVQAMAQITSLADGPASWTYELKVSGSSQALDTGALTLDGNGIGYIGGSMSTDSAYTITVTVTDSLGQTASAGAELPTGLYTIHILQGGKGVALGKQAEHYGLEISGDWPIRVEGQPLEEYLTDRLYPVGVLLLSADQAWSPMAQWPWTEWGRLADATVDGVTMAQWVRGR